VLRGYMIQQISEKYSSTQKHGVWDQNSGKTNRIAINPVPNS
jgi:hypothetical protein